MDEGGKWDPKACVVRILRSDVTGVICFFCCSALPIR